MKIHEDFPTTTIIGPLSMLLAYNLCKIIGRYIIQYCMNVKPVNVPTDDKNYYTNFITSQTAFASDWLDQRHLVP